MCTCIRTSVCKDQHKRIIVVFSAKFLWFDFYYTLGGNKVLKPREQTDLLKKTLLLLSLRRVFPDTPAGIAPHSPSGPPDHTHTLINKHTPTRAAITAACWNFLDLLVMRHLFSDPPIEDSLSEAVCHKSCASLTHTP